MIEWAADAFERHRRTILALVPGADVHHVGSTGIGAGLTKGDLDICVRVGAGALDGAVLQLGTRYRRNTGSTWTTTFAAFEDETEWVGVQLCAIDGPEDNFLMIRDRLRGSPDLLRAYDEIKQRHQGGSMDLYRAEKSAFMERLLGHDRA